MKTFSIITAAAAVFAFLVMAPNAQAQPVCAPSSAKLSAWESEKNGPNDPQLWIAKVYCNNGRVGEVRRADGVRDFIAQISWDNGAGRTFDPDCGRAVDAYCY